MISDAKISKISDLSATVKGLSLQIKEHKDQTFRYLLQKFDIWSCDICLRSALDAESERVVQKALDNVVKGTL